MYRKVGKGLIYLAVINYGNPGYLAQVMLQYDYTERIGQEEAMYCVSSSPC